MADLLFPFSRVRDEQKLLVEDVRGAIDTGKTLLAHAPTGIGKTAASLSPALTYGKERGLTVFFATPKHSQHVIAIETLKRIQNRCNVKINAVDIIGKQWTCLEPGARDLASPEFKHFCDTRRRNESCPYYCNVYRNGNSEMRADARELLSELELKEPLHNEELHELCKKREFCPYEIAARMTRNADVVICDYYHLFHPKIRAPLFSKGEKTLGKSILVIDEAHNLPGRVRDLMSDSISDFVIKNSIKEARFLRRDSLEKDLQDIMKILTGYGKTLTEKCPERFVEREDFINDIESATHLKLESLVEDLEMAGELVLGEGGRYRSFCLNIAGFLSGWQEKKGADYSRILQLIERGDNRYHKLLLRCLDPATYTSDVFKEAQSSVLMSGTLLPLEMHEKVLGIENAILREYENPFPKENRLVLLTNGITTKYDKRSDYMFDKIATTINQSLGAVPGNCAVFFPSYDMLETIIERVRTGKELLVERKEMKKGDRMELYKKLVNADNCALFAVQAGSFSEGMDFPGRMLDCVIVVGLPLAKPDLDVQALIGYYDFKFNRGWDYGYIYPAMNRAMQAAGRCIRSETDRGAIILMDDRFKWRNYSKCFPSDLKFVVTERPAMYVEKFFGRGG